MSDIWGAGFGDSHLWKRGETRQLGSVQNELRGTRFTCERCKVSFFFHYNMFPSAQAAIKAAGVDDQCSDKPNLVRPLEKRLEQLQKELAIVLKPVPDGEYDCLEHVRSRLLLDIRNEIKSVQNQLNTLKT